MKWTFEKLQKEADKCLTRGYTAANKHNLMDEIFKNHMNQGYSRSCNKKEKSEYSDFSIY